MITAGGRREVWPVAEAVDPVAKRLVPVDGFAG